MDPAWPDDMVIIADEIAEEIDARPEGNWDRTIQAEEYGIVIPPFSRFWCEARTVDHNGKASIRGVSVETGEENRQPWSPAEARWIMRVFGYIWNEKGAFGIPQEMLWSYPGIMLLHVSKEGMLLDNPDRIQIAPHDLGVPMHFREMPLGSISNHVPYLLYALGALHAKCEIDHVHPKRQQRRALERETGQKIQSDRYVIRNISIDASKPQKRYVRNKTPNDASRKEQERHAVRGHFRWYGEKGMFGKEQFQNIMVFIPDHERGEGAEKTQRKYTIKKAGRNE